LIDDDVGLLMRTGQYLRAKGYEVKATHNVFEIPSLVNVFKPNLIVLDVKMPALSGEGVAVTLRRMCDAPIVFYSAVLDADGEALAAQHIGAQFVSKAQGVRILHDALTSLHKQQNAAVVEQA
jgi:DNA-binding response OmpR family regulator